MAIGDSFSVYLGTATENRQPSSGVEEHWSDHVKGGATDTINLYDGSTAIALHRAAEDTASGGGTVGVIKNEPLDTAFLITNSVYARKTGTTDRVHIGGVQTNA